MTPTEQDKELRVIFTNEAPEDKEWSAHIHLLNEWTTTDRYLREIVQYARSGPFYPADMHVSLIEQLITADRKRVALEARLEALDHIIDLQSKQFNRWTQKDIANFFNGVGKYYRELKAQQEELS